MLPRQTNKLHNMIDQAGSPVTLLLYFAAGTLVVMTLPGKFERHFVRPYILRPIWTVFTVILVYNFAVQFWEHFSEQQSGQLLAVKNAAISAFDHVAVVDVWQQTVQIVKVGAKVVLALFSVVALRLMMSTEQYTSGGRVEYTAEPLLHTYIGFYWALFCYVGLGWSYSRRRRFAATRPKDVELQWWAIATFYTLFDLPDIAGGTVGWSLNKYRQHLSKWKQSKTYYLLQLTAWPIQCIINEACADSPNFAARLRRDLLYPDLRVVGSHPYPANYQDNVWTHNIHALVSKSHYALLQKARRLYSFDNKFHFLDLARAASFPVTPDLEVDDDVIGVLFRKRGAGVPDGVTIKKGELVRNNKVYMKHTSLEMGAGVHVMDVGEKPGQWEAVGVTSATAGIEDTAALDLQKFRLFRLAPAGDWVAQAALRNCKEVQRWISPESPLSTYRVVTTCTAAFADARGKCFLGADTEENKRLRRELLKELPPKLVCMAFRAGRKGKLQDKLSDGAVFYGVNLKTKCIEKGTTYKAFTTNMPNEPSYATHPDTGVKIDGQSLFFDESSKICRDAHAKMCPGVPIIGWDVALSEIGPVLVEANSVFLPCYGQVDYWEYMDEMDKTLRFIDAHRDAQVAPEEPTDGGAALARANKFAQQAAKFPV